MTDMDEPEMSDLVSWLRTQLDADEAHARKDLWALDQATPTPWRAHYGHNLPASSLTTDGGEEIARFTATDGPQRHPTGELVDGYEDRHQRDVLLAARLVSAGRARAERVLADIAAKRAILGRWVELRDEVNYWRSVDDEDAAPVGTEYAYECVVRRLAIVYADRSGYQEAWKP